MLDPHFNLKGTWQAISNPFVESCHTLCWHARSLKKICQIPMSICKVHDKICQIPMSICKVHDKICQITMSICKVHDKICQIPMSTCQIFVDILFRGQSWEHVYVHSYFSNKSKKGITCNVDILNISDRAAKLMSRRYLTIVIQLIMLKGECWFILCFSWLYIKSYWGEIFKAPWF